MTDLKQILACNMKNNRKILGLSQANLAAQLNAATNYISMIESEKKFPSLPMLEKIAKVLHVDTLELFSIQPLQKKYIKRIQETMLTDITVVVSNRLDELDRNL